MTDLIARLKNTFAKSRFANPESAVRHVSLIAGGTIIAQAVGTLTIPIISRIYSPADYGIMAIYASILAILGSLSGFRYYFAIPLPKDTRYAHALVILSLGLQIIFVSVLALLLFIAGSFLLSKLSVPQLIPYRGLIPLGLFFTGSYLILMQWAIREKLFSTVARTKITQSLGGALAKIILGLLGIRPLGLLIGTIVAQGGGITTLARSLLKKKGLPHTRSSDIRRVALKYRNFPLFNTWSGLLNVLGGQIVPIFLAAFFSPQIAGLYAMGQRLLFLPADFVGKAIGQVFLQRASVARYSGGLQTLSLQTYTILLQVGFFPLLLISFFAPSIFSSILGERWQEAGTYARVLGPWIAFAFAYSPITMLYVILNRQKTFLVFESVHLLLKIFSVYYGYYYNNPLLSIALISVVGLFTSIGRTIELFTSLGANMLNVIKDTSKIILEALVIAFFPISFYIFGCNIYFQCITIFISGMIYLSRSYKILQCF